MNLSLILRTPQFRYALLFLFAISIALTQLPLFNYLGYEFSFVVALVLGIVGAPLVIGVHRRFTVLGFPTSYARLQGLLLIANSLFLALPFAVISLNALLVRNCSFWEGLGFYVLIAGIAAVFVQSLASLCAVLFKRSLLSYFVIVALIVVVHPLYLGYFTPAIFSYNQVYGFFPGISYDEALGITPRLILFRLVTMVKVLLLFFLSNQMHQHQVSSRGRSSGPKEFLASFRLAPRWQMYVVVPLFLALVFAWLNREAFGFESSRESICSVLNREVRTEHFVIHYSRDAFSEDEIGFMAAEHEFRLEQIERQLRVDCTRPIHSYIYPSAEVKNRFVGVGRTSIAKPWRREMHLNNETWSQVLKHELVHVVAGEFGLPVIRASYRAGLIEGLAMAVEWNFGNRTLHEYASAVERFGLMKNVAGLMTFQGFAVQASSVSYVLCGSFVRFLIDEYGIERLKLVYGGKNFATVYPGDVDALVREWHLQLSAVEVPPRWQAHVKYYFDRKSIFAKECARYVARLNENGYNDLERGEYAEALRDFSASLSASKSTEALVGFIRSAYLAAMYDTVAAIMSDQLADTASASGLASLMLNYGDALWMRGDLASAAAAHQAVIELDLSESSSQAAAARLGVMDDSLLRREALPVFLSSTPDSTRLALLDKLTHQSRNGALVLVMAKILYGRRDFAKALSLAQEIGGLPEGRIGDHLRLARERILGQCSFRLGEYQTARAHFWQAMNFTSNEATRLRLVDCVDRAEWHERNEKMKFEKAR